MKKNTLLIGGIGLATLAVSLLFANSFNADTEAKYSMNRESLRTEQNIDDLEKWLNSTMIDVETGEVITPDRLSQVMESYRNNQLKNITVDWIEHGPDNVGGRTRAILIEHENQNIIWSGGVSGGLYKSTTDANVWFRVDNFPGNQFISSIEQDAGGNVYVATGSVDEHTTFTGNGLYVTPDGGATWEIVPGTENEGRISRVAATDASSTVYFTSQSGLKSYTYGGTVEDVTSYGGSGAKTLAYSMDGQVLVVAALNNATYVSTDWGQSFENVSGNGPNQISQGGFSRIEYAISNPKTSDGTYSIYAATSSANNRGQWISLDNGQTWHQHTPATGANVTNGVIDYRDQGGWNNTVAFDPTDPERVIVGGIDLHEWKQQINNPPSGSWNKISIWFVSQASPLYAHADQHELKWDKNGKLYIGNDGGIGISLDKGETFYPANRGYNITQFYHVAYDRNGAVLGGTQDNGCVYNDHTNSTYQEFKEVSGGDGFSTEISFFNPNVFFTSSQYNSFNRTADGGQNVNSFDPNLQGYPATGEANGIYPFATAFHFAEYFDENSEDSVVFVPRNNFDVGDIVKVPSLATGDTIMYPTPEALFFDDTLFYDPSLTTTEYEVVDEITGLTYDLGENNFTPFASASQNYPPAVGDTLEVFVPNGPDTIVVESTTPYSFYYGSNVGAQDTLALGRDTLQLSVAWDTIVVQDPFQSWFVFYTGQNGGEIWGTRDAARFSSANPKWVRIIDGIGNGFTGSNTPPALDFCWSKDLNNMFVTSGNGIYRVDGLGSAYSTDEDFEEMTDIDEGATATNIVQVASGSFQGIGINKNNPDDLVVTQGFNGSVRRSSNATSANPTFTVVGSQGGPAFYDIIIDRDDSDVLFAATYNGIALSEDGGATWTDVSPASVAGTPCHEIRQSWRTWDEGNYRPGEIYVATYGRGIWSTDAVLSTSSEAPAPTIKKSNISLEVYPNPSRYNSTLVVDLKENDNMEIQFFNISGRMVKRIQKTNAMIGRNEVVFSAEDLPQGTYLIRVQSGNQVQTTKFMKM